MLKDQWTLCPGVHWTKIQKLILIFTWSQLLPESKLMMTSHQSHAKEHTSTIISKRDNLHCENCSLSKLLSVIIALFCPGRYDPDNKFHGANMGPIWVLSAPDGPHVGPMNFAIARSSTHKDTYIAPAHDSYGVSNMNKFFVENIDSVIIRTGCVNDVRDKIVINKPTGTMWEMQIDINFFSHYILIIVIWALPVKWLSSKYHWMSLTISQHRCRLDAANTKTISYLIRFVSDLCGHKSSQGYNETAWNKNSHRPTTI